MNDYRDDIYSVLNGSARRAKGNTRTPNLKPFHTYWMLGGDVTPGRFPLINLKADRPIAKGEELLWDCTFRAKCCCHDTRKYNCCNVHSSGALPASSSMQFCWWLRAPD